MKRMNFWSVFILAVLAVVLVFVIVSLIMASVHDLTIIQEWQSWFPKVEETAKETTEVARVMFSNIK